MSPFALLDRRYAPTPVPSRVEFLLRQPFAHRGLHGPGRVENGRSAFVAAIARGHGIECDVRLSRDGEAIVFHDADLGRLTGQTGPVAHHDAATLARIALNGGEDTILRLRDLIALVAGRVPLLIELKAPDRRVAPLCLAVRYELEGYRGPTAIMSFNPLVGGWFALRAPRIVRGLVISEGRRGVRERIGRRLAFWRARPDFLAYDIRDLPSRFAAAQRKRGLPLLTWTVVTGDQEQRAARCADQPIYEEPVNGR